jgi:hypothetical protein
MKTTPQRHEEEQHVFSHLPENLSHRSGQISGRDIRIGDIADKENRRRESWVRFCATSGAAAWAVIAVLAKLGIARIGQIELLFLFAPLVIVPLGMELGDVIATSGRLMTERAASSWSKSEQALIEVALRFQPIGAAFAVWAICLPPGRKAGALAAAWMLVSALMALGGLLSLFRPRRANEDWSIRFVLALAQIDLAVGAAWLVASRLGMKPMGIQEPLGLLTAVHFHYAGFATATIAAAMLKSAASQSEQNRDYSWLNRIVLAVVSLPYLVAAGFAISPLLKMAAAVLFSASVVVLAISLRTLSRRLENPAARALLQVASAAIFAGMLFSGAYAVADFFGSDALTIPEMAKTHGLLNAMGFCLCGLLGWLIDAQNAEESRVYAHS